MMVKKTPGGRYVCDPKIVRDWDGGKRMKMGVRKGKIDPELGFGSNSSALYDEYVNCLDFGEWAVDLANSGDVWGLLLECFYSSDAERIYIAALIHFVRGFTYIKYLAIPEGHAHGIQRQGKPHAALARLRGCDLG